MVKLVFCVLYIMGNKKCISVYLHEAFNTLLNLLALCIHSTVLYSYPQVHKECCDKFVQSEAAAPPPSSSSNKDTETPSSGLGRLCSECHKPIAVLPNQFSGKDIYFYVYPTGHMN